jgi:hypothetical protein
MGPGTPNRPDSRLGDPEPAGQPARHPQPRPVG